MGEDAPAHRRLSGRLGQIDLLSRLQVVITSDSIRTKVAKSNELVVEVNEVLLSPLDLLDTLPADRGESWREGIEEAVRGIRSEGMSRYELLETRLPEREVEGLAQTFATKYLVDLA